MSLGPFDLSGGAFLTLYVILLICTIIAGFVIPRRLRPEGRSVRVTDPEKLAFLAGGAARLADAVVGRLLSVDALTVSGKKHLVAGHPIEGPTRAERDVLSVTRVGIASAKDIDRALEPRAEAIERALVADGLLINHRTANQLRFWQTSPYLLLVVFGLIKVDIGMEREKPVGFLVALLALTAIFAVIRFFTADRRTRGAMDLLGSARERSDRLRRAPVADEAGLAVALFGTAVLAGSPWSDYHAMRRAGSGDSSSGDSGGGSGCGDGGGGGGGGGGGCGGCGGS